MERQPISSIIREHGGPRLHFRIPDPKRNEFERLADQHNQLLLCSHYGKVVALVGRDDLFARNGNRFGNDV